MLMQGTGTEATDTFGAAICSSFTISTDVYLAALPASGQTMDLKVGYNFVSGSTAAGYFGARITSTGTFQVVLFRAGDPLTVVASGSFAGASVTAATWFTATFSASSSGGLCNNTATKVFSVTLGSAGTSNVQTTSGVADDGGTNDSSFTAHTGGPTHIDNLVAPLAPAAVDSTITVSNLIGFDAAPYHGALIARFGGSPETVVTYAASNLQQLGTTTSQCNSADGVMVGERASGVVAAAYIDCDSTAPGTTKYLKIRSSTFTDPDLSNTNCATNNYCYYTLQTDDNILSGNACPGSSITTFPASTGEIGNVRQVPITYTADAKEGDNNGEVKYDATAIGFAYTNTVNGNVGVFVDVQRDGASNDKSCGLEVPFAPPGSSNRICTWSDEASRIDFVGGASPNGGSRIWRIDIQPHLGSALPTLAPDVEISVVRQLPYPYDALTGIACASPSITNGASKTTIIVQNSLGDVYGLDPFNASSILQWGPLHGIGTTDGVAISGDGKWCLFTESTTSLAVCNARTGTIAGHITLPTGTYKRALLDDTGGEAYVATTSRIAIAHIQKDGFTTTVPVPPGTRCSLTNASCITVTPNGETLDATIVAPPPNPPPAQGIPGVDSDAFATAMGVTKEAGGWLLGLLLITMIAFGAYMAFGKNTWAAGGGGALGFGMSIAFGLLPLWFLLVLVLVGAAIVVLRFKAGGGA